MEVNSRVAGSWTAIDTDATYTVVTNNYIAYCQDGYTTFGTVWDRGDYTDTYTEYAQGWVDYVVSVEAAGLEVSKLDTSVYSTQTYIGTDGCDHSTSTSCSSY